MTQPGISPEQIRRLAEAIAKEVSAGRSAPAVASREPVATGAEGVFSTVDEAVVASRKAYEKLDALGLERRKAIIAKIRAVCLTQAEALARAAIAGWRGSSRPGT